MPAHLRWSLAVCSALTLCCSVSTASAQDSAFARSGVFAIGVDRLFGVLLVSATAEQGGTESTASATEISFLTHGPSQSPHATPRLAFDGFVTDGVSLGAHFGVISQSTELELSAAGMSMKTDGPSETAILVGARVGYGYMFSETVGIWPKLGISYYTDSVEDADGDEVDVDGLALTLDAMLVIAPVPHFGFTVGPLADIGLSGSTDVAGMSVDTTLTDFGLQAGLIGWL